MTPGPDPTEGQKAEPSEADLSACAKARAEARKAFEERLTYQDLSGLTFYPAEDEAAE